jgi:hypothetical protein
MHRFLWDLHFAPVPGLKPEYPIAAVYQNTAAEATSPWVLPGNYVVVLTVNGTSFTQPLVIQMDPRVKVSTSDLAEQFRLSKQLYDEWLRLASISEKVSLIRGQLTDLRPRAPEGDVKTHIDALSERLQALAGPGGPGPAGPGGSGGSARLTLTTASARVRTLFIILKDVDAAPTPQAAAAVVDIQRDLQSLNEGWEAIRLQDVPALNQELRAAGLPALETEKPKPE